LRELLDRGRGNLRALLAARHVDVRTVSDARGSFSFTTVTGASLFTASLALLLPETMEWLTGEADRGRGVLVGVPDRRRLLYRVIDGPSAAPTLNAMFDMARVGFHDGSGPLSPNVYWVTDRRWTPVTSVDGARPRVWLGGELAGVLKRSA
jgi:hypothetical protein